MDHGRRRCTKSAPALIVGRCIPLQVRGLVPGRRQRRQGISDPRCRLVRKPSARRRQIPCGGGSGAMAHRGPENANPGGSLRSFRRRQKDQRLVLMHDSVEYHAGLHRDLVRDPGLVDPPVGKDGRQPLRK